MKFIEKNKIRIISIKNVVHRGTDDYPKIFLNKIGIIKKIDKEYGYPYTIKFDDIGLEEMNKD